MKVTLSLNLDEDALRRINAKLGERGRAKRMTARVWLNTLIEEGLKGLPELPPVRHRQRAAVKRAIPLSTLDDTEGEMRQWRVRFLVGDKSMPTTTIVTASSAKQAADVIITDHETTTIYDIKEIVHHGQKGQATPSDSPAPAHQAKGHQHRPVHRKTKQSRKAVTAVD